MSRSRWAWTKSYGLVSAVVRRAGGLARRELRARPGGGLRVRTVSSLTPLSWVATAVMLMLIWSPAGALGKVGSPHSRASAASDTRRASRTADVTPKPHARRAIAHRARPHAELLAFGTGYAATHGSSAVRRLQRRLLRLGYSPGRIDGRYGPLTERAVVRFQSTHGLQVDGIAGALTLAALSSTKPVLQVGSGYVRGGSPAVRQLQHDLVAAGYRSGPADGRYGPLTERAVMRFQRARHLRVDGIAGPQTLDHLERAAVRRAHHHPRRVRSRPGTTPRRSSPTPARSNSAPSPSSASQTPARSKSAPGPSSASPPQPHGGRGSAGSSSILWIIPLVLVIAAGLGVALWRRKPRHGDGVPAPAQGRTMARPWGNADAIRGRGRLWTSPQCTRPGSLN